MGHAETKELLIARWLQLINDPSLQDLPYKIELNEHGTIEMSPAGNRHGRLQVLVGAELSRQLPDGIVVSEASILTEIGVRVPDVIWGSPAFLKAYGETTPYPRAPEICVEVISPSNSASEIRKKTRAYLAAGAQEVWLVSEEGTVRMFDANGERAVSGFPVTLSLPPPLSDGRSPD